MKKKWESIRDGFSEFVLDDESRGDLAGVLENVQEHLADDAKVNLG